MAIADLVITENYDANKILTESQLSTAMTSIESWCNVEAKLNLEQIGADVFGPSYEYNNDGVQTVSPCLSDIVAKLAENETVAGDWTFEGDIVFEDTVSGTAVFTSTGQYKVKAYRTTSNQSIPDASDTAINLQAESYDTGGMHDVSTNTNRITIPTGGSGVYVLEGQITFDNNNTGRRELKLLKNGSVICTQQLFNPDATENSVMRINHIDNCAANDYFELQVYQNSTGALDVILGENVTYFGALKVW